METQVKLQPNHDGSCTVLVNLLHQTRYIGKIIGDTFISVPRSESKHLFKRLNALGVNLELIERQDIPFRWIEIPFEHSNGHKERLKVLRSYLKNFGTRFAFESFERQMFLPLSEWSLQKSIAFEKKVHSQTELFGEML